MIEAIQEDLAIRLQQRLGVDIRRISESENIFSLGLDSHGFLQLIIEVERKYSVRFSNSELMAPEIDTIAGFSQMILTKITNMRHESNTQEAR